MCIDNWSSWSPNQSNLKIFYPAFVVIQFTYGRSSIYQDYLLWSRFSILLQVLQIAGCTTVMVLLSWTLIHLLNKIHSLGNECGQDGLMTTTSMKLWSQITIPRRYSLAPLSYCFLNLHSAYGPGSWIGIYNENLFVGKACFGLWYTYSQWDLGVGGSQGGQLCSHDLFIYLSSNLDFLRTLKSPNFLGIINFESNFFWWTMMNLEGSDSLSLSRILYKIWEISSFCTWLQAPSWFN